MKGMIRSVLRPEAPSPQLRGPSPGFQRATHTKATAGSEGRVAELGEGLGFDLADALAGNAELATDLLQGTGAAVQQPEPELDDLPLAGGERLEDGAEVFL